MGIRLQKATSSGDARASYWCSNAHSTNGKSKARPLRNDLLSKYLVAEKIPKDE